MTMSNIKRGFEKCGIHPFNPNAINKSRLGTNGAAVDLSIYKLISQPATRSATRENLCSQICLKRWIDEQDVDEEHYIINISTGVPHREEGISSDNQGDFPRSLPDCLQITIDDNSLGIGPIACEHNILVSYAIVSREYADVLKPQTIM